MCIISGFVCSCLVAHHLVVMYLEVYRERTKSGPLCSRISAAVLTPSCVKSNLCAACWALNHVQKLQGSAWFCMQYTYLIWCARDDLQGKLPDEFFEKQNIWLNRGNMYRLLLEPADIANHYGFKFFADSGHYLDGNRAGRSVLIDINSVLVCNKSVLVYTTMFLCIKKNVTVHCTKHTFILSASYRVRMQCFVVVLLIIGVVASHMWTGWHQGPRRACIKKTCHRLFKDSEILCAVQHWTIRCLTFCVLLTSAWSLHLCSTVFVQYTSCVFLPPQAPCETWGTTSAYCLSVAWSTADMPSANATVLLAAHYAAPVFSLGSYMQMPVISATGCDSGEHMVCSKPSAVLMHILTGRQSMLAETKLRGHLDRLCTILWTMAGCSRNWALSFMQFRLYMQQSQMHYVQIVLFLLCTGTCSWRSYGLAERMWRRPVPSTLLCLSKTWTREHVWTLSRCLKPHSPCGQQMLVWQAGVWITLGQRASGSLQAWTLFSITGT